ncbi:MAG TPA: hypothetical protein VK465_15860 [Fibrobacteria bacterium]|nr:hypothetical protein [Fibrobacteria bacterium]
MSEFHAGVDAKDLFEIRIAKVEYHLTRFFRICFRIAFGDNFGMCIEEELFNPPNLRHHLFILAFGFQLRPQSFLRTPTEARCVSAGS